MTSDLTGDTGSLGGGAFYNFPIDSRVTVGLDGRAAFSVGDKDGYLAGAALRVGFVLHQIPLRPYFQLGGGVVHSAYNDSLYNYNRNGVVTVVTTRRPVTSGAAQLLFRLDIRLSDRFDLRAPELGAQASGAMPYRSASALPIPASSITFVPVEKGANWSGRTDRKFNLAIPPTSI
jgi:hypothetical protein